MVKKYDNTLSRLTELLYQYRKQTCYDQFWTTHPQPAADPSCVITATGTRNLTVSLHIHQV